MLPTTTHASAGPSTTEGDLLPQCVLEVRILGPLRIRRGGEVLEAGELGGPKPRQILEILLLNLGTPVSKDRLIDVLWGGRPPAEALPTLESYVSVLRRHLQPGQGKSGPLRTVTGGYVMDPALVDLDVSRFDDLLRRASRCEPVAALELLQEALGLATAPLLGDELTAPWAEEERGNHEHRVCRARAQAAELALSLQQPERAVHWAREALAGDLLNESAWRSLVLGLEESEQPLEALREFEQCRRTLHREMGCTPGETLRAAHARLLRLTGGSAAPAAGATAAAAASAGSASAAGVPGGEAGARATLRILTIDDHRTFAELLTGALDREPDLLSVGSAASVESGVQLCRELVPDVVVMDYHLPDGDGLSAADPHSGTQSGYPDHHVDRRSVAGCPTAGGGGRNMRIPPQGRFVGHDARHAPARAGRKHGGASFLGGADRSSALRYPRAFPRATPDIPRAGGAAFDVRGA